HETPAPVRHRVPDLPPGLDAFFARAFEKDPADRYQDAAAFRAALLEAGRADAIDAAPPGSIEEESPDESAPEEPKPKRRRGSKRKEKPRPQPAAIDTTADASEPAVIPAVMDGDAGAGYSQAQGLRAVWVPLLIAVLFFVTLGGAPFVFARRPAYVRIETRSAEPGSLRVLLDGKDVATLPQIGPALASVSFRPASPGRAAAVAGAPPDGASAFALVATFDVWLQAPRGRHTLDVVARLPGLAEPARAKLEVDLTPGETRTVRLNAVTGPDGLPHLRLD
ncbi:MAG TPA: hypothetical protein VFD06_06610, partial [Candidatus Polarisedimenticolia bacterium]|nr:hypothetical protein [Candidatus Polarisedimenticolia bacterium]